MASRNDDMVISPQVEGLAGESAAGSSSIDARRGRFGGRGQRGRLLRRVAQTRALRRARAARAARSAKGARAGSRMGAGRLLARAGPAAIVMAMVIAAIRLKSGKNLKQMGQAAKSWAAGDALLKAAASQMARNQIFSTMNFTAFEREGQRADKARAAVISMDAELVTRPDLVQDIESRTEAGKEWLDKRLRLGRETKNRSIEAHKIVFDKIRKNKMTHVRGMEQFLMRTEFASQSELDLLILRGGDAIKAGKKLANQMLEWAKAP